MNFREIPKKIFFEAFDVHRIKVVPFAAKTTALMAALFAFTASQSFGAASPFLSASGLNVRNNFGQGDLIPLRGVNLGSWLLMEPWMCPMDSSGLADNFSLIQTLDNRFGVATEQSLIKTYQNTWLTTNDLDNIKSLGMNYVRLPFWWGDVQALDGSWRADAFAQMDWLVTNAWQRGIYTLIDFHGVPGGQSSSQSTATINQNQYWTNVAYQNQTSLIWSNVAAHFNGNPAVLGYDLINEPFGAPSQPALWTAYNSLYQTVRAVDPTHMIVMEGTWSGTGSNGQQLNWQWDVLPPPTVYGWTNVVYSMHAYPGGSDTPANEVNKQVTDFNNHHSWNVPCLIGEFNWMDNTASDWQYGVQQFNQNNMSWSTWSYKATSGSVPNSWGIYDPIGTWPPKPNIQTASANTISNNWSQWKTSTAFGITPFLKQYLGAPLAVADSYTNSGGGTLTVNTNSGVLANDQDINLGQSGISLTAVLTSNPTNGQLTLDSDGSFSYTPNAGFNGIDYFRYRVFDGYVNSANIATVAIQITGNANPVRQLIWTTQPGNATNGSPFGTQPVLQTADQSGNPTTNGLPAILTVTVTQIAGAGPLLGMTNFNIGTSGGNGIVAFTNLQINSAGTDKQLKASVIGLGPSPASIPGCQLWLDASDAASLTLSNGVVTAWADKSGNANNAFAGIGPVAATNNNLYAGSLGAGRVIRFDGTSTYLNVNLNSLNGKPYTIIALEVDGGKAGGNNYFIGNTGNATDQALHMGYPDGSGTTFRLGQWADDLTYTGLVNSVTTPRLWSGKLDTTSGHFLYLNGTLVTNFGSTAKVTGAMASGHIGAAFDTTSSLYHGDLAEVLVYNRALSDPERRQAESYLSNKWLTVFGNAVSAVFTNAPAATPSSQTNNIVGITSDGNGVFRFTLAGTVGATYCVQSSTNLIPPIIWQTLPGSTNIVTNSSGLWFYVVTNSDQQRYYRSAVASP
jgi:endoglucanase